MSQELLQAMKEMDEQFRLGSTLHRLTVLFWAQDLQPLKYRLLMYNRLKLYRDQVTPDVALMIDGLGMSVLREKHEQQKYGVGATKKSDWSDPDKIKKILGDLKNLGFDIADKVKLIQIRDKCTTDPTMYNSPICKAIAAQMMGIKATPPTTTPNIPSSSTTNTAKQQQASGDNSKMIFVVVAIILVMALAGGGGPSIQTQ